MFGKGGKTFAFSLPPSSVLLKSDTLIGFTIPQSKFLLKQTVKVEECDTLRKVCEKQLQLADSINLANTIIINDCRGIMENQNTMLGLKQRQIDKLTDELKVANREIRKQKVFKWLAIGATGVVSGFFGYYVITHH